MRAVDGLKGARPASFAGHAFRTTCHTDREGVGSAPKLRARSPLLRRGAQGPAPSGALDVKRVPTRRVDCECGWLGSCSSRSGRPAERRCSSPRGSAAPLCLACPKRPGPADVGRENGRGAACTMAPTARGGREMGGPHSSKAQLLFRPAAERRDPHKTVGTGCPRRGRARPRVRLPHRPPCHANRMEPESVAGRPKRAPSLHVTSPKKLISSTTTARACVIATRNTHHSRDSVRLPQDRVPGRTGELLYTHALSPLQRMNFCSVDL